MCAYVSVLPCVFCFYFLLFLRNFQIAKQKRNVVAMLWKGRSVVN